MVELAVQTIVTSSVWILLAIVLVTVVSGTFFTVTQQTNAIIERFGKYVRTARPGLNVKIPIIDRIVQRVSLKVQQIIIEVETKTKDDVFVKLFVAVQFRVIEGSVSDAYYKLQNHVEQIKSFVLDVVRAQVPSMPLDEVFLKKDDVGKAVKQELDAAMKMYGFEIPNALVTDVDPAANVKAAMNEIQTQTRLQVAATAKGEAAKILVVKAAEADKESKKLAGEGIANERIAIANGIKESVEAISKVAGTAGSGVSADEAMRTLMLTQYLDTLRSIGARGNSNTIFVPHSPGGMGDLMRQIAEAIMVGNQVQPAPAQAQK